MDFAAPSLTTLYRHHHGWLQGWLRRKLGCSEQAADLAQDTFLRLLGRPLAIDQLLEPRAYLSTVAHGLLVNHLRRRDLERAYLEVLAQQPEAMAPSPEERALLLETLCEIDVMLSGLPPKVRQAFLLSQLEGLPYAEIAGRLGVSLSMVKKYMLRAMTHCMGITQL